MPKLIKFVCIGLISVFISVFSFSAYADKGGNPGKPNKGNFMAGKGNPGKGYKHSSSTRNSSKFSDHKSKQSLPASSVSKNIFSSKDRETATNFFSTHPYATTALPPGIAMNLARGKPLPPGIAKVYLPNDLSTLLGARPGYDYLIAGKDVLLVKQSDQVVVDILHNVLH